MLQANRKLTLYQSKRKCHEPTKAYTHLPDTVDKYRQLVGDFRYISNSSRPYVTYFVERLGSAKSYPTVIHRNIEKATLRYLKKRMNHGLSFTTKRTKDEGVISTYQINPIRSATEAEWASDREDRRSITAGFFT